MLLFLCKLPLIILFAFLMAQRIESKNKEQMTRNKNTPV